MASRDNEGVQNRRPRFPSGARNVDPHEVLEGVFTASHEMAQRTEVLSQFGGASPEAQQRAATANKFIKDALLNPLTAERNATKRPSTVPEPSPTEMI